MKSIQVQDERIRRRVGRLTGLSDFRFGRWVILAAAMMACAYSNAQSTPPSIDETVGVNVNFQDFLPWLSENNANKNKISCPNPGCTFFQNSGIQIVRTDLKWQDLETTTKGDIQFSPCSKNGGGEWVNCADLFVDTLSWIGATPYFILDYSNPLYETANCPGGQTPTCFYVTQSGTIPSFTNFAVAAVGHYQGAQPSQNVWEIWNEPNDAGFWPQETYPPLPPNNPPYNLPYYQLAQSASQAISSTYPLAYLVGPAYASVTNENGVLSTCPSSPNPDDQSIDINSSDLSESLSLPFLLGSPSVLQFWSGLSVHFYRGATPETINDCDLNNLATQIIDSSTYNPTGKHIDIVSSEWGYSTLQPMMANTSQDVNETQQAEYLSRMWLYNAALGIRYSIWYDWHDGGPNQRNGLVRYEPTAPYKSGDSYTPKPAYYAATAIVGSTTIPPASGANPVPIGYLRGFHYDHQVASPAGSYVLAFTKTTQSGTETRYAAWTMSSPISVTLPIQGDYLVVSDLGSILSFKMVTSGGLSLQLTQAPQFILSPSIMTDPLTFAVDGIFNQVLGRSPSSSEFQTYSSELTSSVPVSTIIQSLVQNNQTEINGLYTNLYKTAPTPHQSACFTAALENGMSWLELVDTIRAYPPPAAPSLTSVLADGYDHIYYANCSPQVNQFTWNGSVWSTFNPSTWAGGQMTNPKPPAQPQPLQPAECSNNAADYPVACPPNVSSTSVPVKVGSQTIGEAANGLTSLLSGTSDHVEYIGADQHVWELWWNGSNWEDEDLTQTAKLATKAAAGSALTSLLYPGNEDHVEFIGDDQHVYEFWYTGSTWQATDLTAQTGAPNAASPSALTSLLYPGNEDHVEYVGSDGDVHEFWYNGSTWQTTDLTAQTGAPSAASPSALTSLLYPGNEDHVEYIGSDQHVHQFWYNGTWHTTDLTAQTGAPNAASPGALTSLLYNGNQDHVEFIDSVGHVQELWYNGSTWQFTDLTAETGAPLAASPSALTSLLFPGNEDHVEYIGIDQHVHEFWYNGSQWETTDLTAQTGAPL
jgi:hypothetical protein